MKIKYVLLVTDTQGKNKEQIIGPKKSHKSLNTIDFKSQVYLLTSQFLT